MNPKQLILWFRKLLSGLILKGPILDWWLARKADAIGNAYGKLLLKHKDSQAIQPPCRLVAQRRPPRNLLFLCENMWERRELLPELQKICPTDFLDLGAWKIDGVNPAHDCLNLSEAFSGLDQHRATPFDAIILYLRSSLQSEELISAIRQRWNCPLIGMNLDDKTSFADYGLLNSSGRSYEPWVKLFDVNLSNSRSMVDIYRANGYHCIYLPTGYHNNPAIHRFESGSNFTHALSFVGSCKPERKIFVDQLAARGIEVELYGGGWPRRPFTSEGWKVYRDSQINLGIGYNLTGTQFTNLKNRDFECPGSGGCYLTTYDWELAQLFDVGKEILCYRDINEFVELYTYYRRRPEQCLEIAAAGFNRAVNEHTWEKRFRTVFKEISL